MNMHAVDARVNRVVTTVHGTFANKATWIEPDSKLGKALAARFGSDVAIVPFRWSGGNNPAARKQAQQELRNHLRAQLTRYPGAQHFVIAHSHGGNVALYAMRDAALQERVSGVACLATPFIVARRRALGSKDTLGQVAGAAVALTVGVAIIAQQLLPEFDIWWLPHLLLVVILAISFGLIAWLLPAWKKYAERLVPDLQLGSLSSPQKLLLIRAPGDEAGAGLAFVQFVSHLNVRAYLMLSRRHALVRNALQGWTKYRARLIATFFAGVIGYFGLISALVMIDAPIMLLVAAVLFAGGVFILPPVLTLFGRTDAAAAPLEFVSYLLLFAVICALSVLLLPFGRQIALASVFLDVTAETTPPGEWTVHLLTEEPRLGRAGELQPLQHSMVYDNNEAIRRICDWIASTPRAQPRGTGASLGQMLPTGDRAADGAGV